MNKTSVIHVTLCRTLVTSSCTMSLLNLAVDYASMHGIVMKSPSDYSQFIHAPFSLSPSPFPSDCFHLAERLAPYFNRLIDQISRDSEFIDGVMADILVDEFMNKLYNVYVETRDCRSCNVSNNDYYVTIDKLWYP